MFFISFWPFVDVNLGETWREEETIQSISRSLSSSHARVYGARDLF